MIFNIGYLALVIGLVVALFGTFAGYWGGRTRSANLADSSFHAVYAVGALVVLASVILWYGLLTDQFQVNYVWSHSERALSSFYKFSAFWGGQAGSLLFWTLLLSIYSVIAAITFRKQQIVLMPFVNAVLLITSAFFLALLIFAANPFEQIAFTPPDGQGLNPLLQNYWMVAHPVMLYLGWVGLTIPFAFAVASLLSKKLGNTWVRIVRRWTLVPWMFLSAGIIMGSQWAYMELGWGGYWAWDPVENASFLPWLTATAFLHSIIIQDRRGMLKIWNMVLIWLTYFLVILGTFTTRSGILESVHSLALSNIGPFFLGFLIFVVFGFLWLLFDRLPLLRSENRIDAVMSREAAFLANNWLFLGLAFATLWGTFFPMFSEIVTGQRISVAAPWFEKVNGPLFLLLLIMMGVGPLLGWRRTSLSQLRRQFMWPLLITLVSGVALFFMSPRIYPVVGLAASIFVAATIAQEFIRGVMARRTSTGENPALAFWHLIRRSGQRYGGYIVHLAIVLMGVAIIGNEFYVTRTDVTLAPGETAVVGGYTFVFNGLNAEHVGNRTEFAAYFSVLDQDGQKALGTVTPRRNIYDKTPDQPTSEVGLYMRPLEDLYVVLNGWEDGVVTVSIFINPLTMWLWIGGILLILGTLFSLWPRPHPRSATARAPAAPAIAG